MGRSYQWRISTSSFNLDVDFGDFRFVFPIFVVLTAGPEALDLPGALLVDDDLVAWSVVLEGMLATPPPPRSIPLRNVRPASDATLPPYDAGNPPPEYPQRPPSSGSLPPDYNEESQVSSGPDVNIDKLGTFSRIEPFPDVVSLQLNRLVYPVALESRTWSSDMSNRRKKNQTVAIPEDL